MDIDKRPKVHPTYGMGERLPGRRIVLYRCEGGYLLEASTYCARGPWTVIRESIALSYEAWKIVESLLAYYQIRKYNEDIPTQVLRSEKLHLVMETEVLREDLQRAEKRGHHKKAENIFLQLSPKIQHLNRIKDELALRE